MSNFKVGDKVICIEKDEQVAWENRIEFGAVYSVNEVFEGISGQMVYVGNGRKVYSRRFKLYEEKEMEQPAEQIREEIFHIDTLIEKSKKDIEEAEKKRDSLIEQLREKGFLLYEKEGVCRSARVLSVEDVHVGDFLILTGNSYNSLIQQGRVVSVEVNDKSGIPLSVRCLSTATRDWVRLEDVKLA